MMGSGPPSAEISWRASGTSTWPPIFTPEMHGSVNCGWEPVPEWWPASSRACCAGWGMAGPGQGRLHRSRRAGEEAEPPIQPGLCLLPRRYLELGRRDLAAARSWAGELRAVAVDNDYPIWRALSCRPRGRRPLWDGVSRRRPDDDRGRLRAVPGVDHPPGVLAAVPGATQPGICTRRPAWTGSGSHRRGHRVLRVGREVSRVPGTWRLPVDVTGPTGCHRAGDRSAADWPDGGDAPHRARRDHPVGGPVAPARCRWRPEWGPGCALRDLRRGLDEAS